MPYFLWRLLFNSPYATNENADGIERKTGIKSDPTPATG
jgi:hypothetical protein